MPSKLPTAARLTRVQEILESVPEFVESSKDRCVRVTKARTDEVVTVSSLAAKTAILIAESGQDAAVVQKASIVDYARKAAGLNTDSVPVQNACSVDVVDPSGKTVCSAPGLPPVRDEMPDEAAVIKTGIYCLLSCALRIEDSLTDSGHESRKSRISMLISEYEA